MVKLLDELIDGCGKQSLEWLLITANRDYGKKMILRLFSDRSISSVFVMPNSLLWCHLFAALSYLKPARHDDIEDGDVNANPMDALNTGSQVN